MSPVAGGWPPLLELRQYILPPGRRDGLISLFDAEFVESQEQVGIRVLGQFRDLDDPDRYVWLRGYPTAEPAARAQALSAFYGGPVWAAHGKAANATMVDSDNVLLLAPLSDREPFTGDPVHPPMGAGAPASVFDLTVCLLKHPVDQSLVDLVAAEVVPQVSQLAGSPVAAFSSSEVPNTFPALPVREGESALAWLVRSDDPAAQATGRRRLRDNRQWQDEIGPRLRGFLRSEPTRLRLAPTGRSRLR